MVEEINSKLRSWYVKNKTELDKKRRSIEKRNNQRYPLFIKKMEAQIKKENAHVE